MAYTESERTKTEWIRKREGGQFVAVHHNTRFIGEKTTLVLVGSGLGDIAVIHQIGATFLEMCDSGFEPELGKIVISFGSSYPSLFPLRGDHNVWWCWGETETWIEDYLEKTKVKPKLVLCPSRECLDAVAREHDVYTMYAPLGASNVFTPLGHERKGLCYSGLPKDNSPQMSYILYPFLDLVNFEWKKDDWVSLEDLNLWYNSKLVTFGMIKDVSRGYGMLTNRVFECFASGIPLIYPRCVNGFKETFGIDYRYQTSNVEETLELVKGILDNPFEAIKYMSVLSRHVKQFHSYRERLDDLFFFLGEYCD